MTSPSIQLVCFDLGGVFLRLADGWSDVLQRAGVDQPTHDHLLDKIDIFYEANDHYEVGKTDEHTFASHVAQRTGLTHDAIVDILNAILVAPYPDVDQLLDRLEQTDVQTACLSNTNHTHWQTVTSPGPLQLPLQRLDHRFASHLVGQRKPDRKIYQHVQQQTDTPADAILFFDDSPENCTAAAELGWHAHRIDPAADPVAQVTTRLRHYGVI